MKGLAYALEISKLSHLHTLSVSVIFDPLVKRLPKYPALEMYVANI